MRASTLVFGHPPSPRLGLACPPLYTYITAMHEGDTRTRALELSWDRMWRWAKKQCRGKGGGGRGSQPKNPSRRVYPSVQRYRRSSPAISHTGEILESLPLRPQSIAATSLLALPFPSPIFSTNFERCRCTSMVF